MIAYETRVFLYSLLLGAILGVVYDVFRILRVAGIKGTLQVVLEDIFFLFLFACASFLFFIRFTDGLFRSFVVLGEGIGFLFYHFTLGELVIRCTEKIVLAIRRALLAIYQKILMPTRRIIGKILLKFNVKIVSFLRKFKKTRDNKKIHLKE